MVSSRDLLAVGVYGYTLYVSSDDIVCHRGILSYRETLVRDSQRDAPNPHTASRDRGGELLNVSYIVS